MIDALENSIENQPLGVRRVTKIPHRTLSETRHESNATLDETPACLIRAHIVTSKPLVNAHRNTALHHVERE
jgi:hypothetical protein